MASETPWEDLVQALESHDPTERKEAADSLRDRRSIQAVDALLRVVVDDPDAAVRWAAAEALATIRSAKATKPLLAIFELDEENRAPIAGALVEIGDRSVIPTMLTALQHTNSDVRDNAAYVLGELGGPDVLDPLLHALGDEVPEVRYSAVEALGTLGDVRALPALRHIAEHDTGESWNDFHGAPPGQRVANAAKKAIQKLEATSAEHD